MLRALGRLVAAVALGGIGGYYYYVRRYDTHSCLYGSNTTALYTLGASMTLFALLILIKFNHERRAKKKRTDQSSLGWPTIMAFTFVGYIMGGLAVSIFFVAGVPLIPVLVNVAVAATGIVCLGVILRKDKSGLRVREPQRDASRLREQSDV